MTANKARIVEKPSIASTSSYQFGGERMIKAQRGVLEWQSQQDISVLQTTTNTLKISLEEHQCLQRGDLDCLDYAESLSKGKTPPYKSHAAVLPIKD